MTEHSIPAAAEGLPKDAQMATEKMKAARSRLTSDLEAEAFFTRDMLRLIVDSVVEISPLPLDASQQRALRAVNTLAFVARDRAEGVCKQIDAFYSDCELEGAINAHKVAYEAWSAPDDAQFEARKDALHDALNKADDDLLAFAPATLQQARTKAEYMASSPCFTDWDNIERSDLIKALTPEVPA
jgi:hypothetical protein